MERTNRRTLLRATGGAAVGTLLAGCTGDDADGLPEGTTTDASTTTDESTPAGETYANPVFEPVFADPTVLRTDDGTYYAYATADDWQDAEGYRLVPIVRSTDLVEWEVVGEAFESMPDWKDSGGLWAPEIARHDGRYLLYYSYSEWGDPNPGIGVATADSPAGPFEDHGKLFDSDEIGVNNSIDPFFTVQEGTPYLVWGSFHGIYGVELAADGLDYRAGTKFQLAGSDFEAAYVHERDGYYYLFVSAGSCCEGADSTYRVQVGRAESFDGPYRNSLGDDLRDRAGDLVVEGGERFVGPGHNAVATDDAGTDWLLYHGYERDEPWIGDTPRRTLLLDPLVWEDGWPSVEGKTPSTTELAPTVD